MSPNSDQVSDVEEGVVDEPEATDSQGQGVATDATPTTPQTVDVDQLRADYEAKLARSQQDINQIKSSLQSREAALQVQWKQEREALRKQLREVQVRGMDENERKQYEASLATEEYQNVQQQLEEAQRKSQEFAATLDAQSFFLGQGVPLQKLVLDQGYDALVNSGWGAIAEELQTLRKGVKAPQKKQPAPLKPAPDVVVDKSAPSQGSNWSALTKKYGSRENVYQLIESGQLSPEILPA